jgi:hypothetical protein
MHGAAVGRLLKTTGGGGCNSLSPLPPVLTRRLRRSVMHFLWMTLAWVAFWSVITVLVSLTERHG